MEMMAFMLCVHQAVMIMSHIAMRALISTCLVAVLTWALLMPMSCGPGRTHIGCICFELQQLSRCLTS